MKNEEKKSKYLDIVIMHVFGKKKSKSGNIRPVVPNLGGAPEFTAGAREQIYFEVGLGDKTITIIIVI